MRPEVGESKGFVQQQDGILGRGELQHHGGVRVSGGQGVHVGRVGVAKCVTYSYDASHVVSCVGDFADLTADPAQNMSERQV